MEERGGEVVVVVNPTKVDVAEVREVLEVAAAEAGAAGSPRLVETTKDDPGSARPATRSATVPRFGLRPGR